MIKLMKYLLGAVLVLALALLVFLYFTAYDYPMYPLKADKSKFPNVHTEGDVEQLAVDLINQMTIDEKIEQLYGEPITKGAKLGINLLYLNRFPHIYSGRNERLNIPPFVLSDGPRGARVSKDRIGTTNFPVGMSRGASWDVDLESRINEVIAIEMRANGVNYAATPCINLLRHPGWGRAQETYGEDPWLLGELGVAATLAIQKHNVMACPKHFALNSIENSRFVIDVQLDERTLREVYLPHFKKVVQVGNAASLMTAYNKVQGEYASENHHLLTEILRDEWGFKGFLTSDWFFAVYDGVASIKAGLNVEMPFGQQYDNKKLKKALSEGEIQESEIDTLVTETLTTRLKYAFAEDPMEYNQSLIANPESVALSKEAAEKGMVLLKNDDVLPFSQSKNKTIAVIGALADVENTGDHGSSNSLAPYVITPYTGIKNYHSGRGNEVILDNAADLNASKLLAEKADEVILVVGYTYIDEGEYLISTDGATESAKQGKLVGPKVDGGDRENLKLRAEDEAMIEALAGTNTNLVVVYVGGSGIDMSAWDNSVPAILFAWYSGMEGGNALANVLYGEVNPSGKLPFSIAKQESDYPYFTPYAEEITYGYYHGYTLFHKKNIEVAYPFGFGLSYTNYSYSDLNVLSTEVNEDGTLEVQVTVSNTGAMAGEEVVQMYVGFGNSAVDRPVKLLRDFVRVALQPGESQTVTMDVSVQDLAWYNPDAKQWQVEKMSHEVYVGASSAKPDLLKGHFQVK